jgi:hypothetical protein
MVVATLALSQLTPKADFLQVSVPFTLKDYPKDLKSLNIGNDFACLPCKIKLPKVRDLTSFK